MQIDFALDRPSASFLFNADLSDLTKDLNELLGTATEKSPIFLFLDSLDQLATESGAREVCSQRLCYLMAFPMVAWLLVFTLSSTSLQIYPHLLHPTPSCGGCQRCSRIMCGSWSARCPSRSIAAFHGFSPLSRKTATLWPCRRSIPPRILPQSLTILSPRRIVP